MKPSALLHAKTIGVRDLRENLTKIVKNNKPYLVVKHGERKMFLVPYEDIVDLIEILEESKDAVLREEIRRARDEYRSTGGVPFKDE